MPEQGCVTGAADSASDLDTTAIAVINLLATPDASPSAIAAARSGASWLETQQSADGSFGAGSNANTTGLAGWALGEAGKASAAKAAAGWLRGVQVADLAPCVTTLSAENGAVAPSEAALAETADVRWHRQWPAHLLRLRDRPGAARARVRPRGGRRARHRCAGQRRREQHRHRHCHRPRRRRARLRELRWSGQAGHRDRRGVERDLPAARGRCHAHVPPHTLGGSTTAATSATATPTPTPTHPTPVPEVGALEAKRVVKVKRNRFAVSVACEGTTACAGTLKVRTARKVEMGSGKRVVTLAKRYVLGGCRRGEAPGAEADQGRSPGAGRRQGEGQGRADGAGRRSAR